MIASFDTGPLAAVFHGRKKLSPATAKLRLFGFMNKSDNIEKGEWSYLYSREDEDLAEYLKQQLL